MHYQKLTPKEIQQFIEEYKEGKRINENKQIGI